MPDTSLTEEATRARLRERAAKARQMIRDRNRADDLEMTDTSFAAWQARTGLTVNRRAARVLGVTPQAVGFWVSGTRKPGGSTLTLMWLIERDLKLIDLLESSTVTT